MLPSSILTSRLIFGFGLTFAFQLLQPYRGFDVTLFDTCLSAHFWLRFNFRFSAFVYLTEDSMLPSSILTSRLIFGFGSTFAFQLRQPYRGSILPSSILASRLVFGFGLTFAFQLSSPYRGFDVTLFDTCLSACFCFRFDFRFTASSFLLTRFRSFLPILLFITSRCLEL